MTVTENKLLIGDIPALDLVEEFGSPIYVYDEVIIKRQYRALADSFTYPKIKISYAAKANTNHHILKILGGMGAEVDAVSPGEILAALRAGFTSDQIMFTATSVTDEEMQFSIDKNVLVNVDALSQLERYGKLNPGSRVSVRINPAVGAGHHDHVITGGPDSKFGIWVDDLAQVKDLVARYDLKLIGLHQHIGSGILDVSKFEQAIEVLLEAAKNFQGLEFIDFGGGIGVPYMPNEEPIDIQKFGRDISKILEDFAKNYGSELTFVFEPGRYLVAESGSLLCTINTIKKTPKHMFVGVDTGFNHLVRPMAYGSFHPIVKVDEVKSTTTNKTVVAGNICETGDVFTVKDGHVADRELPPLKEGDVLAIQIAGAYGYSMSSNYNTRPRPAEILVNGTQTKIIRNAEEVENLL